MIVEISTFSRVRSLGERGEQVRDDGAAPRSRFRKFGRRQDPRQERRKRQPGDGLSYGQTTTV